MKRTTARGGLSPSGAGLGALGEIGRARVRKFWGQLWLSQDSDAWGYTLVGTRNKTGIKGSWGGWSRRPHGPTKKALVSFRLMMMGFWGFPLIWRGKKPQQYLKTGETGNWKDSYRVDLS